jgi:Ribonuclease G/E
VAERALSGEEPELAARGAVIRTRGVSERTSLLLLRLRHQINQERRTVAGFDQGVRELERDLSYLMRLWEEIRDLTLRSSAPSLIYEEGSIVKRAIRDIYSAGIDEILVEAVVKADLAGTLERIGRLPPAIRDRVRGANAAELLSIDCGTRPGSADASGARLR